MKDKLLRLSSLLDDRLSDALELRHFGDQPVSSPYVCPGSNTAISRTIHLARLNAAWSGCDQCEWRDDTEGLAVRSVTDTERIRRSRNDGIRRTEFGIRGQYVNYVTRSVAAHLVQIFCACLTRTVSDGRTDADIKRSIQPPDSSEPRRTLLPSIVLGYDGRPSSPDLFVGAASAIREFGLDVIDIGRCTSASSQEAVRCFPEAAGVVIVTGAGAEPSFAGFDVFDRRGESVPVIWKEHEVRLQATEIESVRQCESTSETGGEDTSQRSADVSVSATYPGSGNLRMLLSLPEGSRRRTVRRNSRRSGSHRPVDFESQYRRWLRAWYPSGNALKAVVRTQDPVIADRARWLAAETGVEIVCRGIHDRDLSPDRHSSSDRHLNITVFEDDRGFRLTDSSGAELSYSQTAALMNRLLRAHASHISAHADDAGNRFWLTDTARPSSGESTEHIRDALACIGLLLKLQPASASP